MSDKDKIREMVMALARSKSDPSYLDVAREAGTDVMDAKTERATTAMFAESKDDDDDADKSDDDKSDDDKSDDKKDDDKCEDDDEESDSTMEGSHLVGAAKRHARAGHRDLNSKQRARDKGSRNQATTIRPNAE